MFADESKYGSLDFDTLGDFPIACDVKEVAATRYVTYLLRCFSFQF